MKEDTAIFWQCVKVWSFRISKRNNSYLQQKWSVRLIVIFSVCPGEKAYRNGSIYNILLYVAILLSYIAYLHREVIDWLITLASQWSAKSFFYSYKDK